MDADGIYLKPRSRCDLLELKQGEAEIPAHEKWVLVDAYLGSFQSISPDVR